MKNIKTKLLVLSYYISSTLIFIMHLAGIDMGLRHVLNPFLATAIALAYMYTLGRYRIRYGFFPAVAGFIIDVGIWKTAVFFVIPFLIFFGIRFGIERYSSSFIIGKRRTINPDFDLSAISKVITCFNLGATQDAREAGALFEKMKA